MERNNRSDHRIDMADKGKRISDNCKSCERMWYVFIPPGNIVIEKREHEKKKYLNSLVIFFFFIKLEEIIVLSKIYRIYHVACYYYHYMFNLVNHVCIANILA